MTFITETFELLYPLNRINYFNEIHRICCANYYIKSLNVLLKSVLPLLKYRSFSKGLFLLPHPVFFMPLIWFKIYDSV